MRINKTNKILIITASVLAGIALIVTIIFFIISKEKENEIVYTDKLTCNNYFSQITIDLTNKEVKRDSKETSLKDEFGITEEQEKFVLSSRDELRNLFNGSNFDFNIEDDIAYIKNIYQTKRLLVKSDKNIKKDFDAEGKEQIQDELYLFTYDTYARTKAAYEYFSLDDEVETEIDEVYYIENINDVSQTMYGNSNENEDNISWGYSAMGLDNYKNIINENRNEKEVTVATIGYGINVQDDFFKDRVTEDYYNFIDNSIDVKETIPQGSRIAEVIIGGTNNNVKIMPLVVVNEENYSCISSIIKAITYATKNSDVVCYELLHTENKFINDAFAAAFKENIPVSCVSSNLKDEYPANNPTTIAVSSLDRSNNIADYSGKGDYIDFAASSTDVKEIFDKSATVSKWSGAQYSNANIVAAIALIKSYEKQFNILEVYNFLRNFCVDLGKEGKDELYGYGMPNFKELTIADIDKKSPEIKEVSFSDENWEKTKMVKIVAKDDIRINAWQITNVEAQPNEWNTLETVTPDLDVQTEINVNGKYYIWVVDTAGNMQCKDIEITKVDSIAPTINSTIDASTLDNGYITINVTAEDKESGLADLPYSWDNSSWSANLNTLKVTDNGTYTIYVKDKMGNVSNKEIKISSFAKEGNAEIGDGIIIKKIYVSSEWNEDTNNNVQITFNNNIKIKGWQITTNSFEPNYFNSINLNATDENTEGGNSSNVNSNTNGNNNSSSNNSTVLNNHHNIVQASSNIQITAQLNIDTDYYIWVKDENNNVYMQRFKIMKVEY